MDLENDDDWADDVVPDVLYSPGWSSALTGPGKRPLSVSVPPASPPRAPTLSRYLQGTFVRPR